MDNGVLLYPYQTEDYKMGQEIGNGQFSIVYEATSAPPRSSFSISSMPRRRNDSVLSPPATPVRTSMDLLPRIFAVKRPVDKGSAKVCRDEARTMTLIREVEGHDEYTVPFHGLDNRCDAIVMGLMSGSLASFTKDQLNVLPLVQRTEVVAASFQHLASRLINGLQWLHTNGIIHGDIKPGNILLRSSDSVSLPPAFCYDPVFADFSSATVPDERPSSPREAPIAGGTWDYMYFDHIKNSRERRDVLNDGYGLVMTLLYYAVGDSPYRAIPNRWLQMDARKRGKPIEFVMRDPELAQRFEALASRQGFENLRSRFEKAFDGDWKELHG